MRNLLRPLNDRRVVITERLFFFLIPMERDGNYGSVSYRYIHTFAGKAVWSYIRRTYNRPVLLRVSRKGNV